MPRVINLGGTQVHYTFGSVVAFLVLIVCVVAALGGISITPPLVVGLIGALALAVVVG
jgi:hypothetical protein